MLGGRHSRTWYGGMIHEASWVLRCQVRKARHMEFPALGTMTKGFLRKTHWFCTCSRLVKL